MSPLAHSLRQLDAIAACGPTTGKKQLLAEVTTLTKHIIEAALNPYKMYGVKKFPTSIQQMATQEDDDGTELFRTLDALQKRVVTGHKALQEISFLLGRYLVPAELLSRIINKDLRCGAGATLVNSVFPGLIPEFKVALAQEYEGEDCEFAKLASIKYDGLRCLAFVDESEVTFKTRNGLEITSAESIKPWLHEIRQPTRLVFDGELKKRAGHFQDSSGSIRKKSEQAEDLEYQVFDVMTEAEFVASYSSHTQTERLAQLSILLKSQQLESPVKYVEHHLVFNDIQVQKLFREMLALGHEGLILKDPNAPYQFKRSNTWIKLKDRKTADVRVIGFEPGKGKYKGMMGALVVDFNGKPNKIGTGFSDLQRSNSEHLLGKMVEISYHELTKDGNMRHSRFEKERGDLE